MKEREKWWWFFNFYFSSSFYHVVKINFYISRCELLSGEHGICALSPADVSLPSFKVLIWSLSDKKIFCEICAKLACAKCLVLFFFSILYVVFSLIKFVICQNFLPQQKSRCQTQQRPRVSFWVSFWELQQKVTQKILWRQFKNFHYIYSLLLRKEYTFEYILQILMSR